MTIKVNMVHTLQFEALRALAWSPYTKGSGAKSGAFSCHLLGPKRNENELDRRLQMSDSPMGYNIRPADKKGLSKVGYSGQASKRLSITLPPDQIAYLQAQAEASGISFAEAARRAIARDAYLQQELRNGASLFVKTNDGLYELIP